MTMFIHELSTARSERSLLFEEIFPIFLRANLFFFPSQRKSVRRGGVLTARFPGFMIHRVFLG